ncbi:MAG TPA: cytochrome c3 family protein [Longimicrobiales bacterium]
MRRVFWLSVLFLSFGWAPARAQLISPGKLTRAHADLEGMRQCVQCHELGQRGASNQRCLSCHTTLKSRLSERRGYHATVVNENCGSCHKDHLGRAVSPVRFDTAAFRHETTGYRLRGSHAEQSCRECHAPAHIVAADVRSYRGGAGFMQSTYLGLGSSCRSCHATDDPHEKQFGTRGCQQCHDEQDWEKAPLFKHNTTDFKLTGAHESVECAECHKPPATGAVRFGGIPFGSCADCHRDPHAGRMEGACTRCHSTADWRRVDSRAVSSSFNHARTGFPLKGAHVRTACAHCHERAPNAQIRLTFTAGARGTFPRPAASSCAACHVDPHPGSFGAAAGRASCNACHNINGWREVNYSVERHNRAGNFVLAGAHVTAPCNACHVKGNTSPARTCAGCHAKEDPHRGAFGKQACGDCHTTDSFLGARMDHKRVAQQSCVSCHQKQDPHRDQFAGRSCSQCHSTETFRISAFDHGRTRYPLDGAHQKLLCAQCHSPVTTQGPASFIRYKPLPTACKDCHGGNR